MVRHKLGSGKLRLLHKVILAGVFIGCLGCGFAFFFKKKPQEVLKKEKVVQVEAVQRGTIAETIDFIGTIRSTQQTSMTTKTKGVLHLLAEPGQVLKKGALIASLENKELEHHYALLQESEMIAGQQWQRAAALLEKGLSSKKELEEKKAAFLEAQRKGLDAKMQLKDLMLAAPFEGVVGLFKFREGSQLRQGEDIVDFYDPHSMIVEFGVPLKVAKRVQNGASIVVKGQEYPLTHIQKMLDEQTHMCPAYVQFQCASCIIGTAVSVQLVIEKRQDTLTIPYRAVFFRNKEPFVYTIKDNKVVLSPVTLGIRQKAQVEVRSGLTEADKVIVEDLNALYPEMPVRIAGEPA